jgi:uncharacterized YigZ family protein
MSLKNSYKTVLKESESLLVEKKSKFIANVKPVDNEEDAIAFVNSIRSKYPDATHNVYAYVIDENNIFRYSDDGEPSGTAGMPVLDAIRKSDIVDAAVVVTRYFGGTLLGTGGLVHAYGTAASEAVSDAGRILRRTCATFCLHASYGDYQKLQALFVKHGAVVEDTQFETEVSVYGNVPTEVEEALQTDIRNATADRARYEHTGSGFFSVEI